MGYLPIVPESLATLRRDASTTPPSTESAAVTHAKQLGHTFLPGQRVLDQKTQTEGTVVMSAIAHGVTPRPPAAGDGSPIALLHLPAPTKVETVTVKLDTGQVIMCHPDWLVSIPPALTVPLESLQP